MFDVNIPVAVFLGAPAPFLGYFILVYETFCLVDLIRYTMATLSDVLSLCQFCRHVTQRQLFKYSVVSIYVSPLSQAPMVFQFRFLYSISYLYHQLCYLFYATIWSGVRKLDLLGRRCFLNNLNNGIYFATD